MEHVLEPPVEFSNGRTIRLQERIQGRVITPIDPGYDAARQAWNLTVDQRPAVIVMVESAFDVVEAVRFAKDEGLGVAVQSTGHGNVRPANDCLLIITSPMKQIRVDPVAQTAWIQAGVKWGEVLAQTQLFGLAPLLGSSPDVGAIGYTLGGGFGWLGRKYGLAIDSVHYFDAVTADGEQIRASHAENPDLFWGMRGGGGSLAIVTAMEVQLFPVTTVYGGNLYYPVDRAKEVIARYRSWIAEAPEELTSSIVIMNYPPVPDIPDFLRGQSFVIVRGCFCGPAEEGERLLHYWRDWQPPAVDDFKAMPFSQVATISNDPVDPLPGMGSTAWLADLSDDAIAALVSYGASHNGASPLTVTEIRHAGGAIARLGPKISAYSNRDETLLMQVIGITSTPEARRRLQQYIEQFKTALRSHLTDRVYMNFLEGEESRARIRDGFSPAAYRRLATLKAIYDPENRFGFGFNILPDKVSYD